MAAFSHCSFLLSAFCDQALMNSTPHQLPLIHQTSSSNQTICTDTNQSSSMMTINDHNEPPFTETHSPADTSMAPVKLENPNDDHNVAQKKKKRKKRANYRNGSSKQEGTEGRNKKQKKSNNSNGVVKQEEKPKITQGPPTGYIHVRARRGEATDSHSLAERVRREKISERMRTLQRLVPGCDKITGKAQVLDEIINYVHSLQNQVEFLSMKLASVNPTMFGDFTMGQDTAMGTPDRISNSVASSPLPSVPQCSTNQATNFADDDYSATVFLQGGRSNVFYSSLDVFDDELWDAAEDQRQMNFPYPCGFSTNFWSFQC